MNLTLTPHHGAGTGNENGCGCSDTIPARVHGLGLDPDRSDFDACACEVEGKTRERWRQKETCGVTPVVGHKQVQGREVEFVAVLVLVNSKVRLEAVGAIEGVAVGIADFSLRPRKKWWTLCGGGVRNPDAIWDDDHCPWRRWWSRFFHLRRSLDVVR